MTDEEVVKYDPKVWNEYSKVKPPKKGYFRVELRNDSGEVELRSVEYWDKTFEACYISPKPLNLFFKPWDDDGCFQNGNDHLVCLTVDEVFTLKQMVKWVMKSSRLNNTNKAFLETTYNFLNERFEKAEKCYGSHQKTSF